MSTKPFRVRRASRYFNRFLKMTLGRFLVGLYNVTATNIEVVKRLSGPYVLLPNHYTTWDPFILGYFIPPPVYNVTSDVQFRSTVMRMLLGLVGSIPKSKVIPDLATVKHILAVKNRNGVIGIYPEGRRSWDGHTSHILFSTAKLIKLLKIPVVSPIFKGAYLSLPRWSRRRRRGKIVIDFKRTLTAPEVKALSVEEIYGRIVESTAHDEYEFQRRQSIPYRGLRLAEHLELALFICPECERIGTMRSTVRLFYCTSCHYMVRMNDLGFFEQGRGELRFETVRDWNLWQLEWLKGSLSERLASGREDAIMVDENLLLLSGFRARPLKRLHFGDMSLFHDRIEFKTLIRGTLVFPIREIEGINVQIRERLEFYFRNVLYRFHSGRRIVSAYKWMTAIQILQELLTGSSSSEAAT